MSEDRTTSILCKVRAVIIYDGKILLCHTTDHEPPIFFFPGGLLEHGETIEECLRREIREEIGADVARCRFLRHVENIYDADGKRNHEINFLFDVHLKSDDPHVLRIQEGHIRGGWYDMTAFGNMTVLPSSIQQYILGRYAEK